MEEGYSNIPNPVGFTHDPKIFRKDKRSTKLHTGCFRNRVQDMTFLMPAL